MQRKQIHQQIEIIVGKLYQLNKYLLTSDDMLEIEVDLINTYMAELNRLTTLLNAEDAVKESTDSVQQEEKINTEKVEEIIAVAEQEQAATIISEATVQPENISISENIETEQTEIPETKESEKEAEETVFIKEIIEPVVQYATKEIKVVEAQVKEVVTHIKTEVGNKSLNELFSGNKVELADKLFTHATGKPLKDFISIGDKFMFISELFNKDLMAYESAVKKLNELHSFDEAQQYVEQELGNQFEWIKKQDAAKHFQSVLKKKFGTTDKG